MPEGRRAAVPAFRIVGQRESGQEPWDGAVAWGTRNHETGVENERCTRLNNEVCIFDDIGIKFGRGQQNYTNIVFVLSNYDTRSKTNTSHKKCEC